MYQIDNNSRKPIYEQICKQTEMLIAKGLLNVDDKLPSVRSLSVKLSVNPNTIQRAYTDMCNSGILYSLPGKGCFVSNNAEFVVNKNANKSLEHLTNTLTSLAISGITKEQIIEIVDKIYSGGKTNGRI